MSKYKKKWPGSFRTATEMKKKTPRQKRIDKYKCKNGWYRHEILIMSKRFASDFLWKH